MFVAYVIVAVLTAAASACSAAADFLRLQSVVDNAAKYGVPLSWFPTLGALKTAGAVGVLVGIGIPPVGVAASAGLVLYFIGAIVTVIRARCYSDLIYPVPFLLLAAGSLVLRLA